MTLPSSTLLPETIPPELFSRAATWNSSVGQFGSITGPAIGGVVVAIWNRVDVIYVFDAAAALTFAVLVSQIQGHVLPLARKSATLDSLKEGIRFIRDTKVILAAITLDMFAVLFGGAVALLPDLCHRHFACQARKAWELCGRRHPSEPSSWRSHWRICRR